MEEIINDTYIHESLIDDELKCQYICFKPLIDPVVHFICKNAFCRKCVEKSSLCDNKKDNMIDRKKRLS